MSHWTRLIRFTAVETGGKRVHLGQPVDPKVDGMYPLFLIHDRFLIISLVGLAILKKHSLQAHEISGGSPLDSSARVTSKVLTVDTLLEPIDPQQVGFVRCLGLNYKDHAVS